MFQRFFHSLFDRSTEAEPLSLVLPVTPLSGVVSMVHPLFKLFVRQHFITGLVKAGHTRQEAVSLADEHLTDEFLTAAMADAGVGAPPGGGILAWIIANLPAIMAFIAQIIALFPQG